MRAGHAAPEAIAIEAVMLLLLAVAATDAQILWDIAQFVASAFIAFVAVLIYAELRRRRRRAR